VKTNFSLERKILHLVLSHYMFA